MWEGSPDITGGFQDNGTYSWGFAIGHCAGREVGGRKGWQLPLREQLASLVDSSNSDPALSTGHPFENVRSATYWSASTNVGGATDAWTVDFANGNVTNVEKDPPVSRPVWCVRGDQSFDGNTHDTVH